ncbi:hypothetical protein LIER_06571 [Lithospermum erythrorhizon]|uniref:Uncharacterized protein n=1 Tax=Lithospermum erythrorhizon TaxID=34254 RepID=A0AAV3P5A7_LITER
MVQRSGNGCEVSWVGSLVVKEGGRGYRQCDQVKMDAEDHIIPFIASMIGRITKEHTQGGAELKFIYSSGGEKGIAETPKDPEMSIGVPGCPKRSWHKLGAKTEKELWEGGSRVVLVRGYSLPLLSHRMRYEILDDIRNMKNIFKMATGKVGFVVARRLLWPGTGIIGARCRSGPGLSRLGAGLEYKSWV